MKPMTIARHKFAGDLYKYVRESTGSESTLNYYFAKQLNITAGLDATNRMTIRCDEPLAIGFIIKDIKDADGNLILSDTAWQVNALQPVLNAFNTIDSYTMKAVKYQGIL